jgi:hypothetical protein
MSPKKRGNHDTSGTCSQLGGSSSKRTHANILLVVRNLGNEGKLKLLVSSMYLCPIIG